MTNPTLDLMRILGSPLAPKTEVDVNRKQIAVLYPYALNNKVLLFFLETLKEKQKLNSSDFQYRKENTKYFEALSVAVDVCELLRQGKITYAVFKTLRPYKSTTADIDILIFQPENGYERAVKILREAGYETKGQGPRSTTFQDTKTHIGIDVYQEVSVSQIIYLDKQKLAKAVIRKELGPGKAFEVLKPEADLAAIIAHSVIKEHLYVLSEYYTFLYYLPQLNAKDFVELVIENNITSAARVHSSITAALHYEAHGTIPSKLQLILKELGEEKFETSLLMKTELKMPHRYHLLTVTRALLERTKDKKSRRSFAEQSLYMLNPISAQTVIKEVLKHIRRQTY